MGVPLGGDLARSGIILSEEDEDGLDAQLPAVNTPAQFPETLHLVPGPFLPLLSREGSLATKPEWICWGDGPPVSRCPRLAEV